LWGGISLKQKTKRRLLTLGIILALFVGGVAYVIDWAFFDIQRINGQEYLSQSTSPDGTYTVTAYLNNGGATTDFAVLARLKNNRNGKEKNIYWQYHCAKAEMQWVNDETIKINDKELNVKNEIYDYRRS
jgi:Fe-S cluster biosynthesis and repair protein YggX